MYLDISNAIKMGILPHFHLKVAICTCSSRLETCESALERCNAPVSGKKISRFFAAVFLRNFSLVLQ